MIVRGHTVYWSVGDGAERIDMGSVVSVFKREGREEDMRVSFNTFLGQKRREGGGDMSYPQVDLLSRRRQERVHSLLLWLFLGEERKKAETCSPSMAIFEKEEKERNIVRVNLVCGAVGERRDTPFPDGLRCFR